eukprot:TRINITY_DN24265_c0_g1_i1.p2 TRINITY_DN24265_c0_g1~~TRINITY_DN24265_c0_g1_i1.p2  ORF type:complete len:143 (-),score=30.09 TRINITY_DN24265_c0_g1_i1:33-461(-)
MVFVQNQDIARFLVYELWSGENVLDQTIPALDNVFLFDVVPATAGASNLLNLTLMGRAGTDGPTFIERRQLRRRMLDPCQHCGKREPRPSAFKKCSRCQEARCCSTDCQRADWKAHKPVCRSANVAQKRDLRETLSSSEPSL